MAAVRSEPSTGMFSVSGTALAQLSLLKGVEVGVGVRDGVGVKVASGFCVGVGVGVLPAFAPMRHIVRR